MHPAQRSKEGLERAKSVQADLSPRIRSSQEVHLQQSCQRWFPPTIWEEKAASGLGGTRVELNKEVTETGPADPILVCSTLRQQGEKGRPGKHKGCYGLRSRIPRGFLVLRSPVLTSAFTSISNAQCFPWKLCLGDTEAGPGIGSLQEFTLKL